MTPQFRRYLIRQVTLFIRLITLAGECLFQRGLCIQKIFLFGENNVFLVMVGLDEKKGQAFARPVDFLGSIFLHFKVNRHNFKGGNSSRSRFFPFRVDFPL